MFCRELEARNSIIPPRNTYLSTPASDYFGEHYTQNPSLRTNSGFASYDQSPHPPMQRCHVLLHIRRYEFRAHPWAKFPRKVTNTAVYLDAISLLWYIENLDDSRSSRNKDFQHFSLRKDSHHHAEEENKSEHEPRHCFLRHVPQE